MAKAAVVEQPLLASVKGSWLIETRWTPGELGDLVHVTTLYAVIPKCKGARRYRLSAEGFRDPLHYGSGADLDFDSLAATAEPVDWSDTRVLDRGEAFWLVLSRAAGPGAQAEPAREWLQRRFAGLRVSVWPIADCDSRLRSATE